MSIKGEVKKTGEGRGLLGIALAVGIGFGIVAPLIMWLVGKVKGMVSKTPAASGTGA